MGLWWWACPFFGVCVYTDNMTTRNHRQSRRQSKKQTSKRPSDGATRRTRPVKLLSDSKDYNKRLVLWESASTCRTPQYPRGTPESDPLPPDFPIRRGPDTHNALHTIPHYRNHPLTKLTAVPRETPSRPSLRFSVPINPLDCRYVYKKKGDMVECTITYIPTNVSITCIARCSTVDIRCKAEFRLANVLKVEDLQSSLGDYFDKWCSELQWRIDEQRQRAYTDTL